MKLQKLARWAEIIANLAVVVSVIFLSLEIRKNTKAIESQSVKERPQKLNQSFINSPLIPSILEKIKLVDGPEPGETNMMNRYNLNYQEAAIYGRYLTEIITGLEAEYLQNGPSQGLSDRIQLLFLFPDVNLNWDDGKIPQIQSLEFIDYVSDIRKLPLGKKIFDYKNVLDSLKALQTNKKDTINH